MAEWLRSGLQNRLHQFNSGRGLQSKSLKLQRLHYSHLFRIPPATVCLAFSAAAFSAAASTIAAASGCLPGMIVGIEIELNCCDPSAGPTRHETIPGLKEPMFVWLECRAQTFAPANCENYKKMAPGASAGAISRCSPAGLRIEESKFNLLMIRVPIAFFPRRKGSSLIGPVERLRRRASSVALITNDRGQAGWAADKPQRARLLQRLSAPRRSVIWEQVTQ